jgi:hypothetical protein
MMHALSPQVLRLHPSVPKEGKFALKDTTLPDGTRVDEGENITEESTSPESSLTLCILILSPLVCDWLKGTLVMFLPWVMGRTEKFWNNAMAFNPDRFIGKAKPSPYVFTAFQVPSLSSPSPPPALISV